MFCSRTVCQPLLMSVAAVLLVIGPSTFRYELSIVTLAEALVLPARVVNGTTRARRAVTISCFFMILLLSDAPLRQAGFPFPPFYGPPVLESFSLLTVLVFEVHR